MKLMPWLLFALGNPGEEYEKTYHNAGFLAFPIIITTLTGENPNFLDWNSHKKAFEYTTVNNFIFAKSLMFMNESGLATAEALKKFKVSPDHLVVIHDDSDITLGDFKIQFDRSSGGHKGAQSIIDHTRTQEFTRVRIGIRPAQETERKKAGDFVLASITGKDMKTLETTFEKVAEELRRYLKI